MREIEKQTIIEIWVQKVAVAFHPLLHITETEKWFEVINYDL